MKKDSKKINQGLKIGVRTSMKLYQNIIGCIKKMKNNKYKKSLKLVNKIQKIRSKNNKNWMDLLRLALKLDHRSTSKILSEIYKDDQRISRIAKKIYKL